MLGIIQSGSLGYVSFQIPLRYPTPFFSPTSHWGIQLHVGCRLLSFTMTLYILLLVLRKDHIHFASPYYPEEPSSSLTTLLLLLHIPGHSHPDANGMAGHAIAHPVCLVASFTGTERSDLASGTQFMFDICIHWILYVLQYGIPTVFWSSLNQHHSWIITNIRNTCSGWTHSRCCS